MRRPTSSSSHHHHLYVYIVKTKFGFVREYSDMSFLERGHREFILERARV
jgi:hypothetical protein